jgi:hypothetical protein
VPHPLNLAAQPLVLFRKLPLVEGDECFDAVSFSLRACLQPRWSTPSAARAPQFPVMLAK